MRVWSNSPGIKYFTKTHRDPVDSRWWWENKTEMDSCYLCDMRVVILGLTVAASPLLCAPRCFFHSSIKNINVVKRKQKHFVPPKKWNNSARIGILEQKSNRKNSGGMGLFLSFWRPFLRHQTHVLKFRRNWCQNHHSGGMWSRKTKIKRAELFLSQRTSNFPSEWKFWRNTKKTNVDLDVFFLKSKIWPTTIVSEGFVQVHRAGVHVPIGG